MNIVKNALSCRNISKVGHYIEITNMKKNVQILKSNQIYSLITDLMLTSISAGYPTSHLNNISMVKSVGASMNAKLATHGDAQSISGK